MADLAVGVRKDEAEVNGPLRLGRVFRRDLHHRACTPSEGLVREAIWAVADAPSASALVHLVLYDGVWHAKPKRDQHVLAVEIRHFGRAEQTCAVIREPRTQRRLSRCVVAVQASDLDGIR